MRAPGTSPYHWSVLAYTCIGLSDMLISVITLYPLFIGLPKVEDYASFV
jgi:hypothetical protein